METKFSLVEFSAEESSIVMSKVNAVLAEISAEIKAVAFINENGTIGAKAVLLKKVELVPKSTGTPEVATVESEVIGTETPNNE